MLPHLNAQTRAKHLMHPFIIHYATYAIHSYAYLLIMHLIIIHYAPNQAYSYLSSHFHLFTPRKHQKHLIYFLFFPIAPYLSYATLFHFHLNYFSHLSISKPFRCLQRRGKSTITHNHSSSSLQYTPSTPSAAKRRRRSRSQPTRRRASTRPKI